MRDVTDYVVREEAVDVETFEWGRLRWLDGADLTGTDALTVGQVTVFEGASNAEHFHPNCDEALYLLVGELEHTLGPDAVTLTPGDLIHVPRGERHRATNVGEGDAVALIAYDTGEREVRFVDEG